MESQSLGVKPFLFKWCVDMVVQDINGQGGLTSKVGLNDFKNLFQSEQFYDFKLSVPEQTPRLGYNPQPAVIKSYNIHLAQRVFVNKLCTVMEMQ